ncbi:MarR family winged helix-turn-helix transcriptional regulator [Streptacidiphilus sp. EB129]|uniref:MarR family winged helix-turn-helix transcriptional regulator n=1 Tax=Streptacidiphilus sp. EB129 TaxID=3156262 RepID=UPI003513E675
MPDAATGQDSAAGQDATAALEKVLASLAYLLTRSQAHDRQAQRAGVTAARSDIYLLLALEGSGGISRIGDLATRLLVESPHVTRQIVTLQAQGLVERTHDTQDRRARQVAITAQGRALLTRLREANQASLREALQNTDEEQITATVAVLHQIIEHFAPRIRGRADPGDPSARDGLTTAHSTPTPSSPAPSVADSSART